MAAGAGLLLRRETGKNGGPGAIPKDGSAHPAPYTRKRHRHYANVPETADAGFRSALPLWSCPE